MANHIDFAENFWDSDIVGTQGFEALVRRLKEGNTVCKEIEDFLKIRHQAEMSYSRALVRASQQAKAKDEIGGLRDSWDEMVKETEIEGMHHNKLGLGFQSVAKKIEEFRVDQKERRSKLEDAVKRMQSNKKECYQKVVNNKERYESKCRDADVAEDAYQREEPTATPANKVKLRQKSDRTKKVAKEADDAYKKSLEQLEDSRKKWENAMTNFCQEAQKLEEDRIHFLRDELWEVTNHVSQSCVLVDEVQEEVRKVLEKCLADRDLHLFVQQKRTGNRRPDPFTYKPHNTNGEPVQRIVNDRVEYWNYYQDEQAAAAAARVHPHLSNGRNPAVAPSGFHNLHREPLPSVPDPPEAHDKEDIYSSVPETYSGGNKRPSLDRGQILSASSSGTGQTPFSAKAIYQYTAQDVDELSLEFGQTVTVLSINNINWWLVEYEDSQGRVPSRYLEPIKSKILV